MLSEMTELLSSCGNYRTYRQTYADCDGFKIPIVGIHLKDLISLHEALPDRMDDGRINLSKLQSLYERARELRVLQRAQPPFCAHKDLVHLLTVRDAPRYCVAPRKRSGGPWVGHKAPVDAKTPLGWRANTLEGAA